MPYKNKTVAKEKWNEWYHSSPENRKKIRASVSKRKRRIKEWFKEYKSSLSCSVCDENHSSCLDFHHIDKKDKQSHPVSYMVGRGVSISRIQEEIQKCIVLCANCHRKQHY